MTGTASDVATTRRHLLLVGPEPLRRHLGGARRPGELIIDAAETSPAAAVRNAGLFTSALRIRRIEELAQSEVATLGRALEETALDVVVEAEKLAAAAERELKTSCAVRKLGLGRAGGGDIVREIAAALGLDLAPTVQAELADRLAHDPGRLVGTLEALAAGGYRRPSSEQVRLLAGSSREDGLPWTLLDELEAGRIAAADTLGRLEPIPTIAFLTKRVRLAALSTENPDLPHGEVMALAGETTEGAWRQAQRLGTRLGAANCRDLLVRLAAADVLAKRGRGPAALALAAGRLRLAVLRGAADRDR